MDAEFKLFHFLNKSDKYIRENCLNKGYLYYINARNAHLGLWIPESRGFVISRFKFEKNYLFMEYHYDTGEPYGTVKPYFEIEQSPFDENILTKLNRENLYQNSESTKSVLLYLNEKAESVPFMWPEAVNLLKLSI